MERGIKMRLLLRRINYLFRYLALSFLCLFFLLPADCEELEELVPPCFTGSELDKIREWEKSWVGKKLNFANVDQVKDLLPDFLFTLLYYADDGRSRGGHFLDFFFGGFSGTASPFSPMVTFARIVQFDPMDAPRFTCVCSTLQSASVCSMPSVVARG
jgi:hypothetical protein